MKTHRKNQQNERYLMENKIQPWQKLKDNRRPPNGWLKAIRGALGINTRQLADRLGVQHSSVLRLEKREVQGKATIESLAKAAKAMNCQLIYTIVPKSGFNSLNEIIDQQANTLASYLVKRVRHSMRLESQDISDKEMNKQISQLAIELKAKMDGRLWETVQNKKVK